MQLRSLLVNLQSEEESESDPTTIEARKSGEEQRVKRSVEMSTRNTHRE